MAVLCRSYGELLAAALGGAPHSGTREALNTALAVDDHVVAECVGRPGAEPLIGAAEGLLLVAGLQSAKLLTGVQPRFGDYTDGGAFEGAYGPRLREQLVGCFRKLSSGSRRQASAAVWRPEDSTAALVPRDVPCTLAVSFHERFGSLHMMVAMRSNDAWMGVPYDVVMFRLLQSAMAAARGAQLGEYLHVSSSTHVYSRDAAKAEKLAGRRRRREAGAAPALPEWLGPMSTRAGWSSQVKAARLAVESVTGEKSAVPAGVGAHATDALSAMASALSEKIRHRTSH